MTLIYDAYERQPGKAAGVCTLIGERVTLEAVFAAISRIGSWSVPYLPLCMYTRAIKQLCREAESRT